MFERTANKAINNAQQKHVVPDPQARLLLRRYLKI
jgi:hypothetical protein